MPEISIIMPVFNVEKYIGDSVKSICEQTYRDFEFILVDDGTQDCSIEIAENILETTDVIYKVIHQKNIGLSAARNAGMNIAQGNWVICVDSDDCLHPQTMEIISSYARDETNDVIGFGFQQTTTPPTAYPEISEPTSMCTYSTEALAEAFLSRKLVLIAPALLIRRSLLTSNRMQYDENCRFSEDALFIWNLIEHTNQLCFVTRKLYYYLKRPNSIMTSSGCEKILTGFHAFVDLDIKLRGSCVCLGIETKYILPRWIIGALHSGSKILDYSDFKRLSDSMHYTSYISELRKFPDSKISMLAMVLAVNRYLFYRISKIV